ncbi:MAG: DUF4276 family protein [Anaerolineaceae bacterium]|nr:DUF4276 family protein [Anaerolineaceae bacterium]
MLHIEILVEEPSMEAALKNLLPRLLPPESTFRILTFQGKPDLLQKLPGRMRGYRWITEEYRIVVLVDEDRQDCHELKYQLETAATQAGFITKTNSGDAHFQVLNRIVIEELEAWFLGDPEAVRQAYPNLPINLDKRNTSVNPDTIPGGTWEALERTLQRYGYFRGGFRKVEAARKISAFMDPTRNRSKSFQVFREGLLALK